MRIGNRLSGAVFWAIVATASATISWGADAVERVQPVPLGGAISEHGQATDTTASMSRRCMGAS